MCSPMILQVEPRGALPVWGPPNVWGESRLADTEIWESMCMYVYIYIYTHTFIRYTQLRVYAYA